MTTKLDPMNDMTNVLFLAGDGPDRGEVIDRLNRLGCTVHAEVPCPASTTVGSDLILLDLRDGLGDDELIETLLTDVRPLVVLAEGPCARVRALAVRQAGTMLMTGAEDDSGYRVALNLSRGLAARRRGPGLRGRARPARAGSVPWGLAPAGLGA